MALMFPRLAAVFIKNGYYPTDEPTLERSPGARTDARSPGPCPSSIPAPAKAWRRRSRPRPRARASRASPSSSTPSVHAMPGNWSIAATRT